MFSSLLRISTLLRAKLMRHLVFVIVLATAFLGPLAFLGLGSVWSPLPLYGGSRGESVILTFIKSSSPTSRPSTSEGHGASKKMWEKIEFAILLAAVLLIGAISVVFGWLQASVERFPPAGNHTTRTTSGGRASAVCPSGFPDWSPYDDLVGYAREGIQGQVPGYVEGDIVDVTTVACLQAGQSRQFAGRGDLSHETFHAWCETVAADSSEL